MSVDTKYARGFALSDETDAAAEEVILGLADEVDRLNNGWFSLLRQHEREVDRLKQGNLDLRAELDGCRKKNKELEPDFCEGAE